MGLCFDHLVVTLKTLQFLLVRVYTSQVLILQKAGHAHHEVVTVESTEVVKIVSNLLKVRSSFYVFLFTAENILKTRQLCQHSEYRNVKPATFSKD